MEKDFEIEYYVTFFNGLKDSGTMEVISYPKMTKEQVEMKAMGIVIDKFTEVSVNVGMRAVDLGIKKIELTVTEIK